MCKQHSAATDDGHYGISFTSLSTPYDLSASSDGVIDSVEAAASGVVGGPCRQAGVTTAPRPTSDKFAHVAYSPVTSARDDDVTTCSGDVMTGGCSCGAGGGDATLRSVLRPAACLDLGDQLRHSGEFV